MTEVKLEEELTEEQKAQLVEDENKEKLKKVLRYMETEEYKALLAHFEKEGEKVLEEIKSEIKKRKEAKTVSSDCDKAWEFSKLLAEFVAKIGDSEGELVIKEELSKQIGFAESNVFNRVEELYDAPVYSTLDMLKQKRIDYILLNRRIENIRDGFKTVKKAMPNPNPYEKENEGVGEDELEEV